MSELMVFTGNANPLLAQIVSKELNIPLGKAIVDRFSDGEIMVEILENVRGKDVFLIQPTSAPSNDTLMELIIMADAMRRASAKQIVAVVPYFGYARQDRRVRSARVPITAKIVAEMLQSVGCNRVVTVDLHADQIQGFFYIPVDNIYATPAIMAYIRDKHLSNVTVVSPDVGGVVRARAFAKLIEHSELAIIDKRRPKANESQVMHIIGEIQGRDCIIVDDIVDTAGTLSHAANALKEKGANSVVAYCTHAVLSGNAIQNITDSALDELVVTDTIALSAAAKNCRKIKQISLAGLLAKTIQRISDSRSVSSLFTE